MKFSDVAKGTWAIKPISFRPANTVEAAQPGQPPQGESVECKLGVRVLTGAETAEVYEKAAAAAKEKGVSKWDAADPLCSLYEKAFTLARACVDLDSDRKDPKPYFDGGVEQILTSIHLGTDNIVYLHEQWVQWQDECSPRFQKLSAEQAIAIVLDDMQRKEGEEGPLCHMPHATLVSCVRTLAALWSNSLMDKSPTGSPSESGTPTSKSETGKSPESLDS